MGVDVPEADRGIAKITARIKETWPNKTIRVPRWGQPMPQQGDVLMDIGYFANVVDLGGGGGLATTTDGVGSKTKVADRLHKYDTIGIDCVAMNVNDLICVAAKPISMVDYIAVPRADADILDQIAIGLADGAKQAGVSITGGEVSQGAAEFDLVGTAFGRVPVNHILIGQDTQPGDVIIGIGSNGIHANGLSMAQKILSAYNWLEAREDLLGRSIGEELLRPTFIYVKEVMDAIANIPVKALIHITGDGLLNLNRIKANGVGFRIDMLPPRPNIFNLIQMQGQLDDATMFQTFNIGVGFCVIVPPNWIRETLDILHDYGRHAWQIGVVVPDEHKTVQITEFGLVGRGKKFLMEG